MQPISQNPMPVHSTRPLVRWAYLSGVILALGALLLAGSLLIRAGSPVPVAAANAVNADKDPTITHTIVLPLVVSNYRNWDPRGMIAFERQNESSGLHDIFLMKNDGSQVENLTNFPADDGAPTWSPDGNWIALSSDRVDVENSVYRAIFKIDLRTRELVQLTSGAYDDRWPTWSPDGTRIAFMRRSPGLTKYDIFVMNADGSNVQNITNYALGNDFPAWSRDGEWIAFTSERNWGGRDLWLVRPDGSDARIVLRTDFGDPPKDYPNEEIYPSWGADGRIYYTFIPTKGDELLYRIWPNGSGMEPVFADNYNRYIASWSPDGQCFVFYGYLGGPDKEVWKWCNGMAGAVNLTNNDLSDEFCAWSPVP
jgi:Tol biopolymer transport system component